MGKFLCDRVQGIERFSAHPHHWPSQVLPQLFKELSNLQGMSYDHLYSLSPEDFWT